MPKNINYQMPLEDAKEILKNYTQSSSNVIHAPKVKLPTHFDEIKAFWPNYEVMPYRDYGHEEVDKDKNQRIIISLDTYDDLLDGEMLHIYFVYQQHCLVDINCTERRFYYRPFTPKLAIYEMDECDHAAAAIDDDYSSYHALTEFRIYLTEADVVNKPFDRFCPAFVEHINEIIDNQVKAIDTFLSIQEDINAIEKKIKIRMM